MHTPHEAVNRKWLNKIVADASGRGNYYTGSTPREIAHSIVEAHEMHPAFVGKLDQLITSLMQQGLYAISERKLVSSDNVAERITAARRKQEAAKEATRFRKQTAARRRTLLASWHTEAVV